MDGVLIDSKEIWSTIFKDIGGISRDRFEDEFWGRDLRKNLDIISMDHDEFCREDLSRYLDRLEPLPGVERTLEGIDLDKIVITNTTFGCTEKMLKAVSIMDHFHSIISSDMVKRPKPDPEPVLLGCEKLGIEPSKAYLVGDSMEDMESGSAAGCITVGLGVEGDINLSSITELLDVIDRGK